jgi:hypothetical protein
MKFGGDFLDKFPVGYFSPPMPTIHLRFLECKLSGGGIHSHFSKKHLPVGCSVRLPLIVNIPNA